MPQERNFGTFAFTSTKNSCSNSRDFVSGLEFQTPSEKHKVFAEFCA